MLPILHYGGGGGAVGGDGGEGGEAGGGVVGGGNHRMHCLIRLTTLLREALVKSSWLSCKGKIKGLFSNSMLLL